MRAARGGGCVRGPTAAAGRFARAGSDIANAPRPLNLKGGEGRRGPPSTTTRRAAVRADVVIPSDLASQKAHLEAEIADARRGRPPADGFRYDAAVPLEPLPAASGRTAEKAAQMREDEAVRKRAAMGGGRTQAEQQEAAAGKQATQFAQFVSDRLSVHRRGADTRDAECLALQYYPSSRMPDVSVVIVFYNEAFSTLMRTVWSVLDRSQPALIREVILVDDGSDREHLMAPLEAALLEVPKVRLVRMAERGGLIRAKVHGVEHASGDVLMFIDSHCEVNDGWLEPLLDRIVRNRRTVAMPVIDVIDSETFQLKQAMVEKGVFSWTLYFYWLRAHGHVLEHAAPGGRTAPFACPIMAGGIFAMDRAYFYESGAYDMGQETWGGENIEMSFRLWMCGGVLEVAPCSRIAHVFRARSPYSFKDRNPGITIARNLNRVAEVWMDDWADVYYNITGNRRHGVSDVAERRELRRDLKCHDFRWFMDNVADYMFSPLPEFSQAAGFLRNDAGLCVTLGGRASARSCSDRPPAGGQRADSAFVYLTSAPYQGEIRHEESSGSSCLQHSAAAGPVTSEVCYNRETPTATLYWLWEGAGSPVRPKDRGGHAVLPDLCLEADADTHTLSVKTCDPSRAAQRWSFIAPL